MILFIEIIKFFFYKHNYEKSLFKKKDKYDPLTAYINFYFKKKIILFIL